MRAGVLDGDGHARQDGAGRIGDAADDVGGGQLCEGRVGGQAEDGDGGGE